MRVGRLCSRHVAWHVLWRIQTTGGLLGELVGPGWFTRSIDSVDRSPNPLCLCGCIATQHIIATLFLLFIYLFEDVVLEFNEDLSIAGLQACSYGKHLPSIGLLLQRRSQATTHWLWAMTGHRWRWRIVVFCRSGRRGPLSQFFFGFSRVCLHE